MTLLHKYLVEEGVRNAVIVSPLDCTITAISKVKMDDARSAAFYAMGVSVKSCAPVALFVPGKYLVNTLTAVTEAWFQKVNIIIVAIWDCLDDIKTAWMDRCVLDTLSCEVSELGEYEDRIKGMCHVKGPVLINVLERTTVDYNKIDYSTVIGCLKQELPDAVVLNCYKPMEFNNQFWGVIKAIQEKHTYGVISKYIGGSAVADIGFLICPIECALIDINIFRTRYANRNMKIVLLDSKKKARKQGVDQWIESCNWKCFHYEGHDSTIVSKFCHNECSSVLIWEVE